MHEWWRLQEVLVFDGEVLWRQILYQWKVLRQVGLGEEGHGRRLVAAHNPNTSWGKQLQVPPHVCLHHLWTKYSLQDNVVVIRMISI